MTKVTQKRGKNMKTNINNYKFNFLVFQFDAEFFKITKFTDIIC